MIESKFSAFRPEEIEVEFSSSRQMRHIINFHVTEVEGGFTYDSILIPPGRFTYGGIVNELVTSRYPDDVMQATVNNYLADPDDTTAKAEFDQMQAWRKEAKTIAQRALEIGD